MFLKGFSTWRIVVVVVGLLSVGLIFTSIISTRSLHGIDDKLESHIKNKRELKTMRSAEFWKSTDFLKEEIPEAVKSAAKNVMPVSDYVNVLGVKTFYRKAGPPTGMPPSGEVVVLLHGAAFKSQTWLDLKTIHLLAAMGHTVFAIDLPGYGETGTHFKGEAAEYIHSLLVDLNTKDPIIVSPSMSGGFSLPFLKKYPEGLSGYIPVAPVSSEIILDIAGSLKLTLLGDGITGFGMSGRTELGPELRRTWLQSLLILLDLAPPVIISPSFSGVYSLPMLVLQPQEFAGFVSIAVDGSDEIPADICRSLWVPTLIIYGEKDHGLGHQSRANLAHIPTSQVVELPGARHPAYLDQPDMFHKLLYNFIKEIHASKSSN